MPRGQASESDTDTSLHVEDSPRLGHGGSFKPANIRVKKDIYERARGRMVETQIMERGVKSKEVLNAMLTVPRHLFVAEALYSQAYNDYPLPIGEKQSISQPYMVALMTEALGLTGSERVLEIGAGSGYQSAVLSMLAYKVYSVERIHAIAAMARKTLDGLHCSNVIIKIGDGTLGWRDEAPFDAIISAAASPRVPSSYIEQLKPGGRLVIPIGTEESQELLRITKTANGTVSEVLGGCRFVKLIGRHGWQQPRENPR
ncbi:MAG: protein-L-isoaspartate(D-aspartate) O-methyltransferase [Deltaproteobacteria bacterium]|nr:protein-L-isoaspartate(D-aspartate) O-methyltransferase [Deltaproteobacteria bacterium]